MFKFCWPIRVYTTSLTHFKKNIISSFHFEVMILHTHVQGASMVYTRISILFVCFCFMFCFLMWVTVGGTFQRVKLDIARVYKAIYLSSQCIYEYLPFSAKIELTAEDTGLGKYFNAKTAWAASVSRGFFLSALVGRLPQGRVS